jgi:hypothetical protein
MHDTRTGGAGVRDGASRPRDRRGFLRTAALSGAAVFLPAAVVGCGDDGPTDAGPGEIVFDFGSETDVLRFASALEDLEGQFYDEVVARITSTGLSPAEQQLIADFRQNERAHRDFFLALLGEENYVRTTPVFDGVDFTNRDAVLGTLQTFCDNGVSAYNGAGRFLSVDKLLLAGKIVSVEARQVAAIRDLRVGNGTNFAGDEVVDPVTGLDVVNGLAAPGLSSSDPAGALEVARPFLRERLSIVLPSSSS